MASHVRSFITFGADAPYHLSPRIYTGVRTDSGEERKMQSENIARLEFRNRGDNLHPRRAGQILALDFLARCGVLGLHLRRKTLRGQAAGEQQSFPK
jgi:hypothetical protein